MGREGEPAVSDEGRRVGRWVREADGTLWLDKGPLDPARHLWRARSAWGTDVALVNQLTPDGGVRFTVPDGTIYRATRTRVERYGFTHDFGHGLQWFLPDARWEQQPPLLPAAPLAAVAPALAPALPALPLDGARLQVQSVYVTPTVARHWLADCAYSSQRALRPHRVAYLADLMARDEFQSTPLWFAQLGAQRYLVDGQHRLAAISLGGRSYTLPVITAPVESAEALAALYSRLDRGMVRTFGDIYEAHGLSDELGLNRDQVRRLGAAALHILNDFQMRTGSGRGPSGDARVGVLREYAEAARLLYGVWAGAASVAQRRVETSPVLAVALVTARWQPVAATRFWRNVVWRENLAADAPEATLATWLESHVLPHAARRGGVIYPPMHFARAVAGAWNAGYERRSYRQVVVRDHNAPIRIAGTPYTGKTDDEVAS